MPSGLDSDQQHPSPRNQNICDFAAGPSSARAIPHDQEADVSLYSQNVPQADEVNAGAEQPGYNRHGDTSYQPTDDQLAPPLFDIPANVASTINWLQMDTISFDDDDFQNLFPFPIENFPISPSIGLASSTRDNDNVYHVDDRIPNTSIDHRQALQSLNEISDLQPAPDAQTTLDSPCPGSLYSAEGATVASGEYYVEGDAGRLPRSRRRSTILASKRGNKPVREIQFSLEYTYSSPESSEVRFKLPNGMYEQLSELHMHLCLDTTIFKPFRSPGFLSKSSLEGFLYQYFSHFDQTMPFIHTPSFRAEEAHGGLLLAMMAIGSCYAEGSESETLPLSMHEFLRRYLVARNEQTFWPREEAITLAQIHLLHAVGAGFSLHENLQRSGSDTLKQATRFCRDEWAAKLSGSNHRESCRSLGGKDWVRREELLRTGFCIWLLDCIWAFSHQEMSHLGLDLASPIHLPCTEESWCADEVSERDVSDNIRTPSLLTALRNLYIDKHLPPGLGEFSQILLVHGLIHRTWEVTRTVTQSLSTFEPSAQKVSSEYQPQSPVWPPSVTFFNKWRNSACDCLDILHWKANATIGAASGIEHPTVLHLHLARVILLCPIESLVLFSSYLTRSNKDLHWFLPQISAAEAEAHRRSLQRWASQDQYKARLGAIHAGVVLWHVRMYSINGFYEPTAVAYATLLLWALGLFATKKGQTRPQEAQCLSPPPNHCDIILIDRPTDDELVQQFVRQGYDMHTNITGVGNLFSSGGPRKVLVEGQKLLDNSRHWRGMTNYWLRVLNRLESITANLGIDTHTVETITRTR